MKEVEDIFDSEIDPKDAERIIAQNDYEKRTDYLSK